MVSSQFISNTPTRSFFNSLTENLLDCSQFKISVAFITYGGLQVLLETLQELATKNISGEILTTTYKGMTTPNVLERLSRFQNIKLKIFVPPVNDSGSEEYGFHAKGYLFKKSQERNEQWTIIIGSSNITGRALKTNIEWNVLQHETCDKKEEQGAYTKAVLDEFDRLWKSKWAKDYSPDFLNSYRDYLAKIDRKLKTANVQQAFVYHDAVVLPNAMQQEAIVKLDRLRKAGEQKALAIAATGSGKTYMSVFDVMQVKPAKLLFIVHREDILHKAKESFDKICSLTEENYSSGLFTGTKKDYAVKYLFATRSSFALHYKEFRPDAFDYIILDEAHHASSPQYADILRYFKPKFLLGLTATPERSDSGDVYSIFDNNIAVEIRLRQALEYNLVCPFHYFGLTDADGIDYTQIKAEEGTGEYVEAVAKMLMVGFRVDYIIEKIRFYGHDGDKLKCLGFCQTIGHAEYMAKEFNKRLSEHGEDIAIALSSENAKNFEIRDAAVKRLEDDKSPLNFIFVCDLFNEGIDIPSVNEVLLLRPTESSIIFIQQIGRGLRKLPDKEFVTVLDFIGNYKKSFLMAIALNGKQDIDKDATKVQVLNDFAELPNGTYIHMDKITKQQILAQLESERFLSMKYMRDAYLSFKNTCNNGNVPKMTDYLKHDGAIDPVRFTIFNPQYKSYFAFVAHIEEKSHPDFLDILRNENFRQLMELFSFYCPAKRCEEFVIADAVLHSDKYCVDIKCIDKFAAKYLNRINHDRIIHACEVLSGLYFDRSELKTYKMALFAYDSQTETISLNLEAGEALGSSELMLTWFSDLIEYSLLRYSLEFQLIDYGYDGYNGDLPWLKLYYKYSMRDLAILCNYKKKHSAFRGQGLLTLCDKNFFIFLDLNKREGIKESINYNDQFIAPDIFQWQTPNSTKQDSPLGKKLKSHADLGIRLHLFVRKFDKIENVTEPYTYLGRVQTLKDTLEGNCPVTMRFLLEHRVPDELYHFLITKTSNR